MKMFIEGIGMLAAILTTLSFLPQVVKTYKEKTAASLSMLMLIVFLIGVVLWFVYGVMKNSTPLILANLITAVLGSTLIYFKVVYSKKE